MNRDSFFATLADRLQADELAYVQKMYWLVKEAHRKQFRRLTGERFFEHVRRTAFYAADMFGYYDAETIALALGHDLIEDTFVPPSVLVSLFGHNLYADMLNLSKEIPSYHPVHGKLIVRAKLPDNVYYPNLMKAPRRVKIVKGCDRYDNIEDLGSWEEPRRKKYILETVDEVLPIVRSADLRIAAAIEERLAIYLTNESD